MQIPVSVIALDRPAFDRTHVKRIRYVTLPGQVVEETCYEDEDGKAWSSDAVEVPRSNERSAHARETVDSDHYHHPDGDRLTTFTPPTAVQPQWPARYRQIARRSANQSVSQSMYN